MFKYQIMFKWQGALSKTMLLHEIKQNTDSIPVAVLSFHEWCKIQPSLPNQSNVPTIFQVTRIQTP